MLTVPDNRNEDNPAVADAPTMRRLMRGRQRRG